MDTEEDLDDVIDTEEDLDTIIIQTIRRKASLSYPRVNDSSIHWLEFLGAFDSQSIYQCFSALPLVSPLNLQLQFCDKCSRMFCSPINYRRHIRVHHRLKKLDKDFTETRDLLGAYWDKLSLEEAKEVVSLENVVLEEVPSSSILKSLATLLQNKRFYSFPPPYLMAGAALLDIVQSKFSSYYISSRVLLGLLDDASEKTCLCGTAESVKRFVFDGNVGKIGLEPKNLVACTSFLLEQKLVKAWLADKDAEALRCQQELVEEEEAAQKRKAEILERKRQKKLRQKEQKAREQRHKAEAEIEGDIDSTVKALSLTEASSDTYNFEAHNPNAFSDNVASPIPLQYLDTSVEINRDSHSEYDTIADHNPERLSAHGHIGKWAEASDLHTNQISPLPKPEVHQKYEDNHDNKASAIVSGSEVWSPKSEEDIDKVVLKTTQEKEPDKLKNEEVLIGSISVNLDDYRQSEDQVPVQSGETEGDVVHGNVRWSSVPSCLREGRADPGTFPFSIQEAKAFHAKRWEEAISSDHVTLHLTSESESSDEDRRNIVANADNKLPATSRVAKSKRRAKKKNS